MNGDPLSFQKWSNQKLRFGDIKYHITFWYYVKENLKNCIFAGVCPLHFIPTSVNKNTTPNALLVKKFASQYIKPVQIKMLVAHL